MYERRRDVIRRKVYESLVRKDSESAVGGSGSEVKNWRRCKERCGRERNKWATEW